MEAEPLDLSQVSSGRRSWIKQTREIRSFLNFPQMVVKATNWHILVGNPPWKVWSSLDWLANSSHYAYSTICLYHTASILSSFWIDLAIDTVVIMLKTSMMPCGKSARMRNINMNLLVTKSTWTLCLIFKIICHTMISQWVYLWMDFSQFFKIETNVLMFVTASGSWIS